MCEASYTLPGLMAAVIVAGSALFAPPAMLEAEAKSPRTVTLGLSKATATVKVPFGKSEMIRTDTAFVDIVVADPETADVLPLTDRSLSILGKKIGSTRLSLYGEGKQLVGVFDVEVSYDTSQLAAELAAVSARKIPRLLGERPDPSFRLRSGRRDARQGRHHRQAVRPGSDQFRPRHPAAAGSSRGALR
jgi:hypothetical protein